MTSFCVAKNEAERRTGKTFSFHKTAGASKGELVVHEGGGEHTLMYGSRREAENVLEGVIYAERIFVHEPLTAEEEQKIFDKVQRRNDIEDIRSAAEKDGVALTDEQLEAAADYFAEHYDSDVGEYPQRRDAIEAVLGEKKGIANEEFKKAFAFALKNVL